MSKTLRLVGYVAILLTLPVFFGCSDDDSGPTEPPVPPPTTIGGSIGVYSDLNGTNRNVIDTGGIVMVHVFHTATEGATASQFRVEAPAGWSLLSSQAQYPVTIGSPDIGVAIGYGQCITGKNHVLTLTYQSPGTTAGEMFKIGPHSRTPESIQVVDCSQNLVEDAVGEDTPVLAP